MPYNPAFLNDLNVIIIDINAGNITGPGQAVAKFQRYVTQVKSLGRYSLIEWQRPFINKIYEFGKCFTTCDPTQFLSLLENEIALSTFDQNEILHFFKSEILWNFEQHQKQEAYLLGLLNQYVTNAEFMHTLGHIKVNKGLFQDGIDLYAQAVRVNPEDRFIETKWGAEVSYVEYLIEIEKYDEAEKLVLDRLQNNTYKVNFIRHNWLAFLQNRIKDYKIQELKAAKKEVELRKLLTEEFQSERRKVIELLGLFTAIIAFIFTTVSVAKKFEYTEAINFTSCLGLVLIDFAITISLIFHNKNIPVYKDARLYVALIVTFILYLILSTTTLIQGCLQVING